MPEQPDNLEPTEADIDMVLEEMNGKPVDKGTARANAQTMQERIAQLEAERARLISNSNKLPPGKYQNHQASYDSDLAIARERLAHFQSQVGKSN